MLPKKYPLNLRNIANQGRSISRAAICRHGTKFFFPSSRNLLSRDPGTSANVGDACAHRMSLCSEKRGGVISTTTKDTGGATFLRNNAHVVSYIVATLHASLANIFITVCQIQSGCRPPRCAPVPTSRWIVARNLDPIRPIGLIDRSSGV